MMKKLLCGILAALMLLSAVACTGDDTTDTEGDTTVALPDTDAPTEAPTDAPTETPTEEATEPEPETEPPIEIQVPAYEDIGLTALMAGTDDRLNLTYNFADYTYSQLKSDNNLVFTSNKDYVVDGDGLTITDEGWNSVGFAHTLVGSYTAKASIVNRGGENNVRSMGRAARGVKGITLVGDDTVVGVCVVDESKYILTVTERGMGKRSPFSDFREMKHRGGRGVTCHNISEKTGKLASVITVSDDDDIMLITNEGTIIRTSISGINVYSRTASGVIIMRLDESSTIKKVARLEKQEEIEAESEAIDREIEAEPKTEIVKENASLSSEIDSDVSDEQI